MQTMVNKSNRGQMKTKKLKISSLHRPKNNRGQIKIQQTAFMLIAVTVLFVLVGLFFLVIRFGSLKDSATILEEDNARLLVNKLASSPEFSCGNAFGTSKVNCIDADKIMALKGNINVYSNFWRISNIEIRKIYPISQSEIECDFANYPECNIITLKEAENSGYTVSNFVALCRKESNNENIYDKCELAKLIVSYESAK